MHFMKQYLRVDKNTTKENHTVLHEYFSAPFFDMVLIAHLFGETVNCRGRQCHTQPPARKYGHPVHRDVHQKPRQCVDLVVVAGGRVSLQCFIERFRRAQWLRGRALNSRLREPGFESCAAVLKPSARFFTLHCSSSLGYINEYLAIGSGGYVYAQPSHINYY